MDDSKKNTKGRRPSTGERPPPPNGADHRQHRSSTRKQHEAADAERETVFVSEVIGEGDAARRLVKVGAWEFTVPGTDGTEPEIPDTELAKRLGMTLHHFRELSARHEKASNITPRVYRTVRETGGRPGLQRFYSEADALFLVTRSERPEAIALTKEMIAVYMLARRGLLGSDVAAQRAEHLALQDEVACLRADLEAARAEARALAAGPIIGSRLARSSILDLMMRVARVRVGRIAGDEVAEDRRDLDDDLRDYLGFAARSAWSELPSEDLGKALAWLLRKLHRAENRAVRKGRALQGSLPFDTNRPRRHKGSKTQAPN